MPQWDISVTVKPWAMTSAVAANPATGLVICEKIIVRFTIVCCQLLRLSGRPGNRIVPLVEALIVLSNFTAVVDGSIRYGKLSSMN